MVSVSCNGVDVDVHPVGRRWHGTCPFHNEPPVLGETLSVGVEGSFYCYWCGAMGVVDNDRPEP